VLPGNCPKLECFLFCYEMKYKIYDSWFGDEI
jgi:hypothetical protein